MACINGTRANSASRQTSTAWEQKWAASRLKRHARKTADNFTRLYSHASSSILCANVSKLDITTIDPNVLQCLLCSLSSFSMHAKLCYFALNSRVQLRPMGLSLVLQVSGKISISTWWQRSMEGQGIANAIDPVWSLSVCAARERNSSTKLGKTFHFGAVRQILCQSKSKTSPQGALGSAQHKYFLYFTLNQKTSNCPGRWGKSWGITRVTRVHPLGARNVCANLPGRCLDVSLDKWRIWCCWWQKMKSEESH